MYPSSSRMRAISTFSLEAGTSTRACFAMTALRRRVSISAIGSVIVRVRPLLATSYRLPATLCHASHVALQRQLAEAEPAQRELAHVGSRPSAQMAAVPQADLVFRRLVFFGNLCGRGHVSSLI